MTGIISNFNIITYMEQCNYIDPIRAKLGIQYDDDLFSHTIFDNNLCIQSDDEKTVSNVSDLQHALSLPIYYVITHGLVSANINVKKDHKSTHHIRTQENAFFKLQPMQYVYDMSPIGSLLMCSPSLNDYVKRVIDHNDEFIDVLFSTNFKQVSMPLSSGDIDIDAPLFSPPQFSTINKRLRFYDDKTDSSLRFGIVQLNKEMDDEVLSILSSIGTPLTTVTSDEKQLRCFNLGVSEPGKLTNNPDAEISFVNHMKMNNFRCSLEELTSMFGHGIYIMSTCTVLQVNITIDNKITVQYSSETGISPELQDKSQSKMVEKALYGFNNDLETIVYNLNYRWNEMVQHKNDVDMANEYPHVNVTTNDKFVKLREPLYYGNEDEISTQIDEDEISTQIDEDEIPNMDDVSGGKKKRLSRTKKRRFTKKQPKKTRKTKKHTSSKKHPLSKPLRRRSTRHRRS